MSVSLGEASMKENPVERITQGADFHDALKRF